MTFTLSSPAFAEGQPLPAIYTCTGIDRSPELRWQDEPEGTASLVLIVEDPDAPGGIFTHWVLFDIPIGPGHLDEGQPAVGISGINDFQEPGYRGPCPPPGDAPHRYIFTLYALTIPSLGLSQRATRREIEGAMADHIIGEARLTGLFGREYEAVAGI